MKTPLLLVVICSLSLISCKKDKEPVKPESPDAHSLKTILLSQGKWKLGSWTLNQPFKDPVTNADINNMKAYSPACQLDNTLSFSVEGEGIEEENTKCASSHNDTKAFTWNFDHDESLLVFNESTPSFFSRKSFGPIAISRIDNFELVVQFGETYGAETIVHTLVFIH